VNPATERSQNNSCLDPMTLHLTGCSRKSNALPQWRETVMATPARVRGPEKPEPNSPLPITTFPSNGWRRGRRSRLRPCGSSIHERIPGAVDFRFGAHDQTRPGEMPKSYRLLQLAEQVLEADGIEVDCLDLSQLNSEYGRRILPCKPASRRPCASAVWPRNIPAPHPFPL
jgi:hypothetical protein